MTTVIRQDDLIESVADALQFISYYHPKDFIQGVYEAYQKEESQAAKDAMAQILINSRLAHVCPGAPSDLSGHRHCYRIRERGHERAVGLRHAAGRCDQRRRASGLHPSG